MSGYIVKNKQSNKELKGPEQGTYSGPECVNYSSTPRL